ncbi:MAG: GIY-YIG nuclease family protein [Cytophagia bacterium]|nr:GIY-YIG nuclease family protein [Cytophagia bacterium]
MTYHCYILVSDSSGKLYIGQTNDLSDRIRRHNEGYNLATRNRGPWKLLFSIGFQTRAEAVTLERKLKAFKNPDKVKDWIKRQG